MGSTHKCKFLTGFAPFEMEINTFIAKKHWYNKENNLPDTNYFLCFV